MAENWLGTDVPGVRADVCEVYSTREETSLLFGTQLPGGDAKLERRIILAPAVAKRLAAGLGDVMREHEAQSNATPAGSIQSPASDVDAPAEARPMLALVRGLNVGFGFERSFKLSPGSLHADRVILGVRTKLANGESLLKVCRAIGMPDPYLARFEELLPEANTVGFGFEGGAYKVYLEFWDKLRQRVRQDPANVAPETLFLGFKWAISDPSRCALARYTCYPLLSIRGIRKRLAELYDDPAMPSLRAAQEIIDLAAIRIGANDSFVYVEASEEGNPRKSFDLNLYKAGLRVADLYPVLSALYQHYSIPESHLESLSAETGSRTFGHLSGGNGRDGQDFLTVYYEIEAL